MATSYANASYDEEPVGVKTSGGTSPMGSNIFIVKPDDDKANRVHPEAYRHEPVTKRNIGRSILRVIRCKYLFFVSFFVHI